MAEETTIKLALGFGILRPSIAVQLKEQKLKYTPERAKEFEKLRECINHLFYSEILNDDAQTKAIKKLYAQIRKHVMRKNKLKPLKK